MLLAPCRMLMCPTSRHTPLVIPHSKCCDTAQIGVSEPRALQPSVLHPVSILLTDATFTSHSLTSITPLLRHCTIGSSPLLPNPGSQAWCHLLFQPCLSSYFSTLLTIPEQTPCFSAFAPLPSSFLQPKASLFTGSLSHVQVHMG